MSGVRWTKQQLDDYERRQKTGNRGSGVCATSEKPVERVPLVSAGAAEEAHWYDAARCFEIRFTVYSVRPADFDGYDIKALQDFLVTAGILPSDKWNVLSGGCVSRKVATKDEERTVIEITTK